MRECLQIVLRVLIEHKGEGRKSQQLLGRLGKNQPACARLMMSLGGCINTSVS